MSLFVARPPFLSSMVCLGVCALAVAACGNPMEAGGRDDAALMKERAPRVAEAVDDAVLRGRISQALGADRAIDAAAVSVTVNRGEVTLSGMVPAEQIIRVDAIVTEVAGVKLVINALRPTLPAS